MEKLTKKQRHKIYKKSYELIKNDTYSFICATISDFCVNEYNFPELFVFKDNDNFAWLSDENGFYFTEMYFKTIREIVLEFCIAMTE
jgi:hypothetical protein